MEERNILTRTEIHTEQENNKINSAYSHVDWNFKTLKQPPLSNIMQVHPDEEDNHENE